MKIKVNDILYKFDLFTSIHQNAQLLSVSEETNRTVVYVKSDIKIDRIKITIDHTCVCNSIIKDIHCNAKHVTTLLDINKLDTSLEYIISSKIIDNIQQYVPRCYISVAISKLDFALDPSLSGFVYYMLSQTYYSINEVIHICHYDELTSFLSISNLYTKRIKKYLDFIPQSLRDIVGNSIIPSCSFTLLIHNINVKVSNSPHQDLIGFIIKSLDFSIDYEKNDDSAIMISINDIKGNHFEYPYLFTRMEYGVYNPPIYIDPEKVFPFKKKWVDVPELILNINISKKYNTNVNICIPDVDFVYTHDLLQYVGDISWMFTTMLPDDFLPNLPPNELDIALSTDIDKLPNRPDPPAVTSDPFEQKEGYNFINVSINNIRCYVPYTLELESGTVVAMKLVTLETMVVGVKPSYDWRAEFENIYIKQYKYPDKELDQNEETVFFPNVVIYAYPSYIYGLYIDVFLENVVWYFTPEMYVHFHGFMQKLKYSGYARDLSLMLRLEKLRRTHERPEGCGCTKLIYGEYLDKVSPQISPFDNPSGIFVEGCNKNPSYYNSDYLQYLKWKEYTILSGSGEKLFRVYCYDLNIILGKIEDPVTVHFGLFATYDLYSHWLFDNVSLKYQDDILFNVKMIDALQTNENHDRILGTYHAEVLLREQAVSQKHGIFDNVMDNVYGKYGWDINITDLTISLPQMEIPDVTEFVYININ